MADLCKSRIIGNQLAMIRELKAMLTEEDENANMNENPETSKPALDPNLLTKEDEMSCDCGEIEENSVVECDIKSEVKKEIKEEMTEDITWEYIRECDFRECFVDMGSRHLEHPVLKKMDLGKHVSNQEKRLSPDKLLKSNSRRCNPMKGKKPFVCKTCGFRFNRSGDLKRHLMTHTGEKPFACSICGRRFSRREVMGRHMYVHQTEDKPFACKFCDYKASRKEHLTSHIARIHSGEKPYACDICGRKVCLPVELKRHMQCHSGHLRRLYKCYACEFETHNRHGICEHLRRHAGEKPYSCSHCDYNAAAIKDVRRHVRKLHQSARTGVCQKK